MRDSFSEPGEANGAMNEAGVPTAADAMKIVAGLLSTTTLEQAAIKLREGRVDMLPVNEGERLLGSISVWDLAFGGCAGGRDPTCTAVASVMQTDPVVCLAETPAKESMTWMLRRGVSTALVQDRHGGTLGVLTLAALLAMLADMEPRGPEPEYVHRVRGDGG
jgi:CBS domain-containing protein